MVNQQTEIEIDGESFQIAKLPKDIQELIVYHERFNADLLEAKAEVLKCEAAIRGIAAEIEARMQKLKLKT